jgi:hypothetical protein
MEARTISSAGNSSTTAKRVEENAYLRAAVTSASEGGDCFIVFDSQSDVNSYSYTLNMPTTYTSNSYSNYHGSCGSVSGTTTTSQQGYVPLNLRDNIYSKNLHVVFAKSETCQNLANTKWRNNVFFNNNIMNDSQNYLAKDVGVVVGTTLACLGIFFGTFLIMVAL